MQQAYSVLMSVYAKEQPAFLRQSIESMLKQTAPPAQFVLVCDGPLPHALNQVVQEFAQNPLFEILRLQENQGLWKALNVGLAAVSQEWVARMDSDDIALPFRCEKELAFAQAQGLDVVSASVFEFLGDPQQITGRRDLPISNQEIVAFAKSRNPVNHPVVMFRKSWVQRAGGYRPFPGFEDYDLWVRLMCLGAKFGNIPEPLLSMRTEAGLYRRRGGWAYCKKTAAFWKEMQKIGFVGFGRRLYNTLGRCAISLLPECIRRNYYKKRLRNNQE